MTKMGTPENAIRWPNLMKIENLLKSAVKTNLDNTYHASLRAATPGKTLPSKSSKEAPPPVLQWLTLSSVSYFLQAVAVSPPPITVIVPAAVAATTASIQLFVPVSNLAISNTPTGPFQMMVLDASTAALFSAMD